jgi:O-antigen/teichoic acid export membrane protein
LKNLEEKIKHGIKWSLIESVFKQIAQIVISIILARVLTPSDYGLIAMSTVFLALSSILIDSGFTIALLRKDDVNENEYNSIFWFNFFLSILIFLAIYIFAPYASKFYNNHQLTTVIRFISLGIVLSALTIVHKVKLTRELNFKTQTMIGFISVILSGLCGIILAFNGYGVYSLVFQSVFGILVSVILYGIYSKWVPKFYFRKQHITNLFGFSSKILINDILYVVYNNIFLVFIGKVYSPIELAYYSRSETTVSLITNNLTNSIKRVSYPALAKLKNDNAELVLMYNKIIRKTVFFTFPVLLGISAISENLILTLLGKPWGGTANFLELSCISGLFIPLIHFNLNSLNLKGNSSLYLKLQIFHKLILLPCLLIGYTFGIEAMLIAFGVSNVIYYGLTSIVSSRILGTQWYSQLSEIKKITMISVIVYLYLLGVDYFLASGLTSLIFEILSSATIYLILASLFQVTKDKNVLIMLRRIIK